MSNIDSTDPRPSGPKDAALADPPSTEAAASDHPARTPGLGHGVPALDSDHQSDRRPDQKEDQ